MFRLGTRLVPALALAGTLVASPIAVAGSAAAVPAATTACTPGRAACPIRVVFAPGAYTGQVRTTLSGLSDQKWFVLRAAAGQTMIVIVKGAGATRGIVYFPNGQHEGQPGGRVFDGLLPVSGDYRIQVTESTMGVGWSGPVDVVVVIY